MTLAVVLLLMGLPVALLLAWAFQIVPEDPIRTKTAAPGGVSAQRGVASDDQVKPVRDSDLRATCVSFPTSIPQAFSRALPT